MHFIATLAERAAEAGLPFLLIGGNAVIAYGYPRQTRDIDLFVREEERRKWHELVESLGYSSFHIHRVFHMYRPVKENLPELDLMLVDASTFSKLAAEAVEILFRGTPMRIPSLRHLIALKLHALRSGLEHRRTRDLLDVITLVH